jgi:copper chaperone NosL
MTRTLSRRLVLFSSAAALGSAAFSALAPTAALAGSCCQPATIAQAQPGAGHGPMPVGGCPICGMDLEKFAFSKIRLEYDNAKPVDYCSIHCAAVAMSVNLDAVPSAIMAADMNTKTLADADKASWVIGGKRPGVMTARAKWAFARKTDAESFIAENGGDPASFDQALQAAYADMYADLQMIRKKRKEMRAKAVS